LEKLGIKAPNTCLIDEKQDHSFMKVDPDNKTKDAGKKRFFVSLKSSRLLISRSADLLRMTEMADQYEFYETMG
jgi:hypothetical protein